MNLNTNRQEVRRRLLSDYYFPDIPTGWEVVRFRYMFQESKERNGTAPVGDMLSVSGYRGVEIKQYDFEERKRPDEDLENYRVVRGGQLVVNTMWLNHRGLGISSVEGHVSPAYAVYDVSKSMYGPFVHHLLRSDYYLNIFKQHLYGIRPNSFQIKDSDWLSIPILVPDLATQKAIADFLDRETARIDQLIEKKQRLQQRLNERRSTYLDQLTFGHEDQANWKRIPFKWICLIPGGQVDPTLDKWAGLPLIAPNHIEPETGRLLAIESARDQCAISGKYLYPANTVLYSKIRPALAKACIAPESGLCSADMYPIVPSRALLPEYLLMQLLSRTFTNWATQESMRVAMPKINRETLGNFRLVVPPIDIQRRMVAQHALERNRTELLVDAVHHSIELLRELRSALVTGAVGGQSDLQAPASNRPASNSVQDRETTGRATL